MTTSGIDGSGSASADLAALASQAAIAVDWVDARGQPQRVADDVLRTILGALGLPAADAAQIRDSAARLHEESRADPGLLIVDAGAPIEFDARPDTAYLLLGDDGEQRTVAAHDSGDGRTRLPAIDTPGYYVLETDNWRRNVAVVPPRSPSVAELLETGDGRGDPRAWGVSAQLYSLRRDHGGDAAQAAGIGDFTSLAHLAGAAGQRGASALAISPVHAMFAADPGRYSPYGPSSRLFLNSNYIDPSAVLGAAALGKALSGLGLGDEALRLDGLPLIDWPGVARLRLKLLRRMYDDFRDDAHSQLQDDFTRFRIAGGEALESHARFEALHARHLPPLGAATDWRHWPADLRDPAGAGVRAYAHAHDRDIAFHIFLQWLAAQGLAGAQQAARAAGMGIGLIGDLAVGTDPGGSHAWSRQADILEGLSPGAPPDIYNPQGQGWGLTAFSPRALHLTGYAAFIEMLRAALAHTGGLRIDHVLGLARMWLVPQGASPRDGAYLRYPLDDMLRLVALEAWRHRALIIGENLGTVPEGFNHRIEQAGMLGMDVLWFQRDGWAGNPAPFQQPRYWPGAAIATTTTHDLPTIVGWWRGTEVGWRDRLQLLGLDETHESLLQERERDRGALWHALREAGCIGHDQPEAPPADAPVEAVLRFVASAPVPLMLVPLEDLLALEEQPNLPGTIDTHPNWRRRLDMDAARFFDDPAVAARVDAIEAGRRGHL
ncbi:MULTISPECIES: 4-alpha-glucanotransferase [unclassified Achromobacter]|uniref:4-alpha-glucanotransferase n=1 Tax=unclassified Achromobacter TaxID=2626865 RepID=UPI000B51BD23|nr:MULTISPECIES: 4-alpha-glucanotransferase [unclassified Achromobacter]OWT80648.1 4-alpha-glucanotransferase [Achromobacter sp. HZ34]OWT82530.1 4-alpha-glucanotransferase [Achromobacter sp. HZ28]